MKYILLLISVLVCATINAQVTIGSTNVPASFSVLQLDGTIGGFRLPQVSESDRNTKINVSSDLARGLMVFNTDTKQVDYWDGSSWTRVPESLIVRNGLWMDGGTAKLGGSLTRNTSIDLNAYTLNLKNNQATFSVNTNVFRLNEEDIVFQPTSFSVNSSVFKVSGDAINTVGSTTLKYLSDTDIERVTVSSSSTSIEGKLIYKDGNEDVDHVLVANGTGDTYWAKLRPNTRMLEGVIKSGSNSIVSSNVANPDVDITATPLVLPPGKWLIFVNYATASTGTVAQNRRYVWTALYGTPTDGGTQTKYTQMGSPVSINSTQRQGFAKLTYLVDVNEETSFVIKSATRNTGTSTTNTAGGNEFFAVSIIEPGQ